MQPIIRRMITITITETWTITWADATETVWHKTHRVVQPSVDEPVQPLPPLTDDADPDDGMHDPDAADKAAEDA